MRIAFLHHSRTALVYFGPWMVRIGGRRAGRYSNGSWWHSPIHRWRDQPDY